MSIKNCNDKSCPAKSKLLREVKITQFNGNVKGCFQPFFTTYLGQLQKNSKGHFLLRIGSRVSFFTRRRQEASYDPKTRFFGGEAQLGGARTFFPSSGQWPEHFCKQSVLYDFCPNRCFFELNWLNWIVNRSFEFAIFIVQMFYTGRRLYRSTGCGRLPQNGVDEGRETCSQFYDGHSVDQTSKLTIANIVCNWNEERNNMCIHLAYLANLGKLSPN